MTLIEKGHVCLLFKHEKKDMYSLINMQLFFLKMSAFSLVPPHKKSSEKTRCSFVVLHF